MIQDSRLNINKTTIFKLRTEGALANAIMVGNHASRVTDLMQSREGHNTLLLSQEGFLPNVVEVGHARLGDHGPELLPLAIIKTICSKQGALEKAGNCYTLSAETLGWANGKMRRFNSETGKRGLA
eukprot:2495210-Amphidinium_carterae.2